MRYASDDGKLFNSEEECLAHERELNVAKEKEKKLEEQRKTRLKEIQNKKEELNKLIKMYSKDYKDDSLDFFIVKNPFVDFYDFFK